MKMVMRHDPNGLRAEAAALMAVTTSFATGANGVATIPSNSHSKKSG